MNALDKVVNVTGSIGAIATTVENLADGNFPDVRTWRTSLRTASFGGVPFAVESVRTVAGRKTANHEYPYRDEAWIEDLGKKGRQFEVQGFLVENDAITGRRSLLGQRDGLLAACEGAQPAALVHPTLGKIDNVVCVSVEIEERADLGPVFAVRLSLMVTGARIYPNPKPAQAAANRSAAQNLIDSALADFKKNVLGPLARGAAVVRQCVQTAQAWYGKAMAVVNDVKRVIGAVSTLAGDFGRLFGGGNDGFGGANFQASLDTTVSDLLAVSTAARSTVNSAGALLVAAAGQPSDPTSFGAAAQSLVASVAASAADPADALHMLSGLATYTPKPVTTPGQIGEAMGAIQDASAALFRRYAIAQVAVTSGTYQPSSRDDANAVLASTVALIDGEIETAGNTGDDASYEALRALRQSVVADLTARGADLAAVGTFRLQAALPSLVLAQRLYRDPSREPGLVQQIAPIHPAFCPTSFSALAR